MGNYWSSRSKESEYEDERSLLGCTANDACYMEVCVCPKRGWSSQSIGDGTKQPRTALLTWVSLGKSRWGIVWNYFRNVGLFNCKGTRDVGTMSLSCITGMVLCMLNYPYMFHLGRYVFSVCSANYFSFRFDWIDSLSFKCKAIWIGGKAWDSPLYWWMVVGSTSGSIVGRLLLKLICTYVKTMFISADRLYRKVSIKLKMLL